ncbi:hypothetical protein DYQ86_13255 [Acidobacteria bacterium AB60]|nr:hypothetical protein DYQ86_13255 [Acidobacteria bacterium AB60]
MTYLKGIFIGFGAVLLGCLVAPIVWVVWASWRSHGDGMTVSFSAMGLAHHLAHSWGFWAFVLVLFPAGLVASVLLRKR